MAEAGFFPARANLGEESYAFLNSRTRSAALAIRPMRHFGPVRRSGVRERPINVWAWRLLGDAELREVVADILEGCLQRGRIAPVLVMESSRPAGCAGRCRRRGARPFREARRSVIFNPADACGNMGHLGHRFGDQTQAGMITQRSFHAVPAGSAAPKRAGRGETAAPGPAPRCMVECMRAPRARHP